MFMNNGQKRDCKDFLCSHNKRCTSEIKLQQPEEGMIVNLFFPEHIINLWCICYELLWGQISRTQKHSAVSINKNIQIILTMNKMWEGIFVSAETQLLSPNMYYPMKTQIVKHHKTIMWKGFSWRKSGVENTFWVCLLNKV